MERSEIRDRRSRIPLRSMQATGSELRPGRRLQARGLDAGDRAGLVLVRCVAGNADRSQHFPGLALDQNSAGHRHHAAGADGGERIDEHRHLLRAIGELAGAEPHAQRAPGLGHGDVGPQDSRSVLALERHEMTAGIEHGDGERRAIRLASFFQRDLDDGAGRREGDGHGGSRFLVIRGTTMGQYHARSRSPMRCARFRVTASRASVASRQTEIGAGMRKPDRENPVGIIGLGLMGGAIGRNLVADGWRVIGHDIDAARRGEAEAAGIEIAQAAAKLAERAPNILVSLPDPQALHASVAEIAAAKLPRRTLAEMSSFALSDKIEAEQALRAAGHVLLDCPISGTGAQAKVKDLVVYASGDCQAIRRLRPLFAGFARAVHDLGAFGNGSRMKYVANLLVAINNVASAEAMVLGLKAGLDAQTVFDMVRSGAANSRVFELRAPMMVEDRYDGASMKMSVWQKDMAVIGEFAHLLGCPTPMFDASVPIYERAMRGGHAAHDTAAVCAVLEKMAGVKRQTKQRPKRA